MTTLVWDGRTLAADRCRVSGRGSRQTCTKLVDAGDYVLAICGDLGALPIMQRWLAAGAHWDVRPEMEDNESRGLAVRKADGALFLVQGKRLVLVELPAGDQTAMGSGAPYALAAMACGKDARRAVEIAAMFDDGTGLGVDAYDVTRVEASDDGVSDGGDHDSLHLLGGVTDPSSNAALAAWLPRTADESKATSFAPNLRPAR